MNNPNRNIKKEAEDILPGIKVYTQNSDPDVVNEFGGPDSIFRIVIAIKKYFQRIFKKNN